MRDKCGIVTCPMFTVEGKKLCLFHQEMYEKDGAMPSFGGGSATSSKIPRYDYIPREAMDRLAGRFEKGVENHKDKAWNATSANQQCLKDMEMIKYRIGHVISHAYKLLEDLQKGVLTDDHMAAIMWGGAFLCCALKPDTDVARLTEKSTVEVMGKDDPLTTDEDDD